ncbi:hydantoinase/oxoprolinase N-terminal domain-containing protein [Amycolatopsis suaedae]|uniref:Hydantoinase/oxoprolinase family protein n=1 Tax=Amycolatopsis suaedae TaxID=2510978 RepID=A0A4Q7J0L3_9PSEU|nr:hydantoinase/oxoprolinase family protein [Amycolatopsis suaedae]RZQ60102.1 hydantoinase/oxoprolinase family protein [Amycolatopsis suaedae]
MRIGLDVGGTHTDAVLLSGTDVVAATKTPTTADVTGGVRNALRDLLSEPVAARVRAVMIGTTTFTNALVEGKRLTPTAAIRLGLPATAAIPPMTGWPARLREALRGRWRLCDGGYEYDGSTLSEVVPEQLRAAAEELAGEGVRAVAVSSVFAPVNGDAELRAAQIVGETVPELRVTCSHEVGSIGLLERENAAILNAALGELAEETIAALTAAVADSGVTAPLLLSQNDGTLMALDHARRFPIRAIASGPTNSMRGAALLSGVDDCAVIDIGGTTTDIGVLSGGVPREASSLTTLAGVRTNGRMPDLLSLGIGGGSLVRGDTVGPDSVGHDLTTRALAFGGSTLTATDLATAAGWADVGDRSLLDGVDPARARRVLAGIGRRIADAVDRMRTSPEPLPAVVVGGGSVLLPHPTEELPDLRRPEHYAVANAIGAAIAAVGGEVDRVVHFGTRRRRDVLAEAKEEAVARAEAAGARAGSVRVVALEEIPLAYLTSGATRVRIKAVGDLDIDRLPGEPEVSCA